MTNLTTPDKCPGHRFPDKHQIAKLRPGERIFCVWCGLTQGYKEDPRPRFGARVIDLEYRRKLGLR
jgi:hypothetical protein